MESEFIAKCDLNLHLLDGKPSPSVEKAKEIKVAKGKNIPVEFIPDFLRYNQDYLANLVKKDGIPVLTKEQEKKYGVSFAPPKIIPFKEAVDKEYDKWTMEKLKQKLAKLGDTQFKDWTEKEFGEDFIDRRKSSDNIIVKILENQEAE